MYYLFNGYLEGEKTTRWKNIYNQILAIELIAFMNYLNKPNGHYRAKKLQTSTRKYLNNNN